MFGACVYKVCEFVHRKCFNHTPIFVTLFRLFSFQYAASPGLPEWTWIVWPLEGGWQREPVSGVCLDMSGEVSRQGAECLAAGAVWVEGLPPGQASL